MRLPTVTGRIERRLLVSYRVDPEIAAALLPDPFRPQLVRGHAVAGICLLRLGAIRPPGVPAALGLRSENAAHRIAVEWDTPTGPRTGVYIPRRDTGALANVLAGGRLFPGVHHRATFTVAESAEEVRVAFAASDGSASVDAAVRVTPELRGSGLFTDLAEASAFYRQGSAGYSATRPGCAPEGVALESTEWRAEATEIQWARSSFFADPALFPPGSAELDSALLMRDIAVTWRALAPLPTVRAA